MAVTQNSHREKATRGRPRAFDVDAGRHLAARRFARDGYDGVAVADLCADLGINPPSFYAAYGSKEALFRAVLADYSAHSAPAYTAALDAATSPGDLRRRVLQTAVGLYTRDGGVGCMVLANLMQRGGCDPLAAHLRSVMASRKASMRARLEDLGLSPPEAEAETRTIAVAMMGLSAAARGGMNRTALGQVVDGLLT